MNQKIPLTLVWATSSIFAAATTTTEQPKYHTDNPVECSYDCDLFNRHKKVFFMNVEALYWAVNEGSLDYAIKMKKPANNPTDAVGHYKVADFGWDPGVRVNFGHFNAPHFWDFYGQYTYFRTSGEDSVHAPHKAGLFLNGTFPHPTTTTPANPLVHAKSEIELR